MTATDIPTTAPARMSTDECREYRHAAFLATRLFPGTGGVTEAWVDWIAGDEEEAS